MTEAECRHSGPVARWIMVGSRSIGEPSAAANLPLMGDRPQSHEICFASSENCGRFGTPEAYLYRLIGHAIRGAPGPHVSGAAVS